MTAVQPTDLLGLWSLQRRLVDRRIGVRGRVTGTLELSMNGDRVRWFEQGILDWDGRSLEVHRELVIVPDGAGWLVCFADERPFHPWLPGQSVEHPCAADLYRGFITADDERQQLRVLWDVTGPTKVQRIFSRCCRRPESGHQNGD